LSELHRFFVWVGEQLPDTFEIDGKRIEVNDLIWRCIHKKKFSDEEKKHIEELVLLLEKTEKYNEETLAKAMLTRQDAIKLYHESASLLRAIMDIRECEEGKVKLKESKDGIKIKIDDAKRWLGFLKGVGKKE
ncbi:MAG: methyl-accepting chemotaxis protein, partial [Candidatus Methanoperedens sp.]|nr:methyl-accepting chemotaxis protein [Candidatus Methanoperedens sp.]